MKSTVNRLLALCALLFALPGCKIAVIVVEGGEVQSLASGTCTAGAVCLNEVSDTSYTESFTAVPLPGWSFVKWNNGGDFLCEDQVNPTCTLTTVGAAGTPVEDIIDSDATYYIQPIFVRNTSDIPSIVGPDGNEWADLSIFAGVTYAEIAAACPGGNCSGTLNGWDMSGWTWASAEQVRNLLNIYSSGQCPSAPCDNTAVGDWLSGALADGFNITGTWAATVQTLDGYMNVIEPFAYAGIAFDGVNSCIEVAGSDINACNGFGAAPTSGGWFLR